MSTWNDYIMPRPGKGSISSRIALSNALKKPLWVTLKVSPLWPEVTEMFVKKEEISFQILDTHLISLKSPQQGELCFSSPIMLL